MPSGGTASGHKKKAKATLAAAAAAAANDDDVMDFAPGKVLGAEELATVKVGILVLLL